MATMSLTPVSRRNVTKMVGGIAAVLGSSSLIGLAGADEEEEDEEEEEEERGEKKEKEEEKKGEEAEVKFDDQAVEAEGRPTVYVDEVKVPDGGWIVIHNWGTSGPPSGGAFIGVSAYLEGGEYENLPVELRGTDGRAVADPPTPSEDTKYVLSAMAHRDDPENRTFDFPGGDPPNTDDDGNVVQTFATITFEAD